MLWFKNRLKRNNYLLNLSIFKVGTCEKGFEKYCTSGHVNCAKMSTS